MATAAAKRIRRDKVIDARAAEDAGEESTVSSLLPLSSSPGCATHVGWLGVRFSLPPDWNVTGFSTDPQNGYIRVDAPGAGTMSVQVRWTDESGRPRESPTAFSLLAHQVRKRLKLNPPLEPDPDLKAVLDKMLKDTAKDAKKSRAPFESHVKSIRTEGPDGERTSLTFTWTGGGRGQGKIWRCATCGKVVVAQVIGMPKDQHAMAGVASGLFSSIRDHAVDGFNEWALYDLRAGAPKEFALKSHKLLSGHLQLVLARGAEQIVIDRWGLANITLKKFTDAEWLEANATCTLKGLERSRVPMAGGHEGALFTGKLSAAGRLNAVRTAGGSVRGFPTRYTGGVWHCQESNKLYAVQILHNRKTRELWNQVIEQCVCH